MPPDPLDALLDRLRDHGRADGPDAGDGRDRRIEAEARALRACAAGAGLRVVEFDQTYDEFQLDGQGLLCGTEHLVEWIPGETRFGKITIPPGFGLVPFINWLRVPWADPRHPDGRRPSLEFRNASVTEYLVRCRAANELFGDDIALESVICWRDGQVSLATSQPQYHGEPAEMRDIERYFLEAGWVRLREPEGHLVFYNFAFNTLAVDAAPRNCYLNHGGLQPFDVILCEPDDALSRHLGIG